MADAIVELQHSYRFDAQSGIGHFARAVNAGDFETASATSQNPDFADLNFIDPASTTLQQQLLAQAVPAAEAVIESATIEEALKTSLAYRVLCAMHAGPRGVEAINNIIEARLTRLGHIQPRQLWYRGRPILITRNDPGTRLYNGDTGLIWPDANGHMMAWFPDSDTGVRAIAPGRLPAHQTCYAMTVHKTQGSEFTRVLLVLPEAPHSLLSRDLLYTGITRARRVGEIYADTAALQFACETRRERVSGLRGWLWG
jgi:exodeoxyribonuclease V alpha subunit